MDLALRWIFLMASTMAADVSCSADISDDDDVVDDVIDAEAGDAVDILDDRPHDDAADDDVMMGLLWRYVMHSGSHQAWRSRHHSLTGLVLIILKEKKFLLYKTV